MSAEVAERFKITKTRGNGTWDTNLMAEPFTFPRQRTLSSSSATRNPSILPLSRPSFSKKKPDQSSFRSENIQLHELPIGNSALEDNLADEEYGKKPDTAGNGEGVDEKGRRPLKMGGKEEAYALSSLFCVLCKSSLNV